MRVFIPTGVYPPDVGGPATYVPLLEKYLPRYGFTVDVLPFRVVRFLPKGISHLVYFFMALARAFRADIIYAQDAVSVGFPARLASVIARKPFVVKIVGDHVWEQARQRFGVTEELDDFALYQMGRPYLLFLRALQLFVVRGAKQVIVPGHYLKKIVMRWGVPEDHIEVVYNGVELPPVVHDPDIMIARPLIVSVGRLVPWKGFDEVIRAVSASPWHLTIVGDGPLRKELESLAHSEGCGARVHFTGLLPREKLHGLLKVADAFVLYSTYEGLPHVLIEAMALGTPVVASDIEGNREVVTNGREGILVSSYDDRSARTARGLPSYDDRSARKARGLFSGDVSALYDAIKETLENKEETQRRVTAARLRAADFSVEQTMQGLVKVLHLL